MQIAELIALAKVRSGKSQKEMAADMGYTHPQQVSKIAAPYPDRQWTRVRNRLSSQAPLCYYFDSHSMQGVRQIHVTGSVHSQ